MTPDLKRLCEAARAYIPCPYDEEGRPIIDGTERDEAARHIVEAVLIELGSISSDQIAAGSSETSRWPWLKAILAEPAKA